MCPHMPLHGALLEERPSTRFAAELRLLSVQLLMRPQPTAALIELHADVTLVRLLIANSMDLQLVSSEMIFGK